MYRTWSGGIQLAGQSGLHRSYKWEWTGVAISNGGPLWANRYAPFSGVACIHLMYNLAFRYSDDACTNILEGYTCEFP